ncbi:MAG: 1-deoxy-D-xylulose-5-phosphate synthase [Lachnospiraceae bacterium]|nr:1-deoxy-D-xylulose-5-phosphate synthase [Lachnospiraceae bacterium]
MYLEQIEKANDIKKLPESAYPALAQEIREFIIDRVSEHGGHLGSNLGVVELTMALHLFLDLPKDRIIWDVGHQCYTHKILTGRQQGFSRLRCLDGMSGFPRRSESECDAYDTGHSSTSLSAGIGMVKARELAGDKYTVVSVIGDGSMTGGLAYEALNNASKLETNFIIVLNDNNMSISENIGGMSKYLNNVRTAEKYLNLRDDVYYSIKDRMPRAVDGIRSAKNSLKQLFVPGPGMVFENLGITYLGPVDGHDIRAMRKVFQEARKVKKAVIVHVLTQKGRGYEPAVRHPARFHGTGPFLIETGLPRKQKQAADYTDVFSTIMCKLGQREERVVAITAAMTDGTGLKRFRNLCPDRFFDVGIAEGHAVTFAAGMAAGGYLPVVAIYSSFLQRAYDEIMEDVCLQNLPVIFAIDRAGLVGRDGETHHGIFDLSYLSQMPGLTVMAPKNKWELSDMMKFAVSLHAPVAIRYPRGTAYAGLKEHREKIQYGKAELIEEERDICLFALGNMVETAEQVRTILKRCGYSVSLVNARFMKPLDVEMISRLAMTHQLFVTMEENIAAGGFGESVRAELYDTAPGVKVMTVAIRDRFVPHGDVEELRRLLGIDADSVAERILCFMKTRRPAADR